MICISGNCNWNLKRKDVATYSVGVFLTPCCVNAAALPHPIKQIKQHICSPKSEVAFSKVICMPEFREVGSKWSRNWPNMAIYNTSQRTDKSSNQHQEKKKKNILHNTKKWYKTETETADAMNPVSGCESSRRLPCFTTHTHYALDWWRISMCEGQALQK